MPTNFADRLLNAIAEKAAPVCVGFDPQLDQLPDELRGNAVSQRSESAHCANLFADFGREVLAVVAPLVPAVKINIAFFEPYGPDGVRTYMELVGEAQRLGLMVIGDVKRADIGHSAERYAVGQLSGRAGADGGRPDAVTVNPYFGLDGVKPFLDVAREEGRGVFVLVQTSNPSASQFQGLLFSDGDTVCQKVARMTEEWAVGAGMVGERGYSCVGAVVSPRDLASTDRVRSLMPHCIFLVPGFGAQGRSAEEVARCFKADGTGAIVTASRSVICAHREPRYRDRFGGDWRGCIEQGCQDFITDVRRVTGR
jgi:orotidine-5'-phosphate decarboxylase